MALKVNKTFILLGRLGCSPVLNCSASEVSMRNSKNYFTYINEISQPMERKAPIVSADKAVSFIKSGDIVFCSGAAATPTVLITAMVKFAKERKLKDLQIWHMHTEGKAEYNLPENKDIFRSNSMFMGANARKAVAEGRADNISIFLHEIPELFYRKHILPDVALVTVSPPDKHGFCSTGTSVDCVRAGLMHSKKIIAQINCQMPRTFGDSLIHSSHFDAAIEIDEPLPEHKTGKFSDAEIKIGQLIAENLVENGATLQMGIGNIPDAVLNGLHYHKDLGIHSEMFANGVVELVKKGCITNNQKKYHQGRIVGSFLIGDKNLYDFVNDNPFIEMLAVDYVNNTRVIARNPKMTAINSCVEVDLTGQVNADSIGTRFYSGFGGQVDFVRGAAQGEDRRGRPIIAMPSVTCKGESKIVPLLKPGAGVVTTRAHVHYLVTEYGIASLFGKNMRQRAYELIKIAHPDHRETLQKAAFERLKVMPSP